MEKDKVIEPRLGDSIPDSWTKKAESEMRSKYRTIVLDHFRGEEKVELHIHQLTSGDDSVATDAYTRVFNRLLRDPDFMMREQLSEVLEEKGVWGKKQEDKVEDVREDMHVIELKIAKMRQVGKVSPKTIKQYRDIWFEKRNQLSKLLSKKSSFLSNSVEGRAEEEEIKAKLFLCVKLPNGNRIWDSIDELNNESDRVLVTRLVGECMLFWAGLTQEIIDELPAKLIFGGEESELEN